MSPRRIATRRDLPMICMFYSVLIAIFVAVLSRPGDRLLAKKGASQSVSGTVQKVFHEFGRSGNYFNLTVNASDGVHRLTEEDLLTDTVPEMADFVPGDIVTAEVKHDAVRNLDWCWSLTRNGKVILTRERTMQYLEETSARDKRVERIIDETAIPISTFLFAMAIVLRLRYGAWTDRTAGDSIKKN